MSRDRSGGAKRRRLTTAEDRTRRARRTVVILGALALFTVGLARSAPRLTEFCKVAHDPQGFEGSTVILRARMIGGHPHGFALYDPDCTPGLEFDHSDPEGDARLKEFLRAVARNRGLTPELVEGVFVGAVSMPEPGAGCCRRFVVSAIRSLDVGPMPPVLTLADIELSGAATSVSLSEDKGLAFECDVGRDGLLRMCLPADARMYEADWEPLAQKLSTTRVGKTTRHGRPTAGRRVRLNLTAPNTN